MKTGDKIVFGILAVLIAFVIGIVGIEIGKHGKEIQTPESKLTKKEAEIVTKEAEIGSLKALKKIKIRAKKIRIIEPVYAKDSELPSDMPPECRNICRYIPKPPKGFKAATPWIHAVCKGKGSVKIGWLRLYARVDGKNLLVFNGKIDGGLFNRYPRWYQGASDSIPVKFVNRCVVLNLADRPDKIWHVWGSPLTPLPAGTDSVWVEVKIFIQGSALVQTGFDYWKDTANVSPTKDRIEGGIGKWVKGSPRWQIISVPSRIKTVV